MKNSAVASTRASRNRWRCTAGKLRHGLLLGGSMTNFLPVTDLKAAVHRSGAAFLAATRFSSLTRSTRQGGEPIPRCDRQCPAECRQGRRARHKRACNPLVCLSTTEHSKDVPKQWRGHREKPWAPAEPPAQRCDHLSSASGSATIKGRRNGASARSTVSMATTKFTYSGRQPPNLLGCRNGLA
jgi:hypothetical protein